MLILLTGASGYLGSRLAASLIRDGHQVRGLVRATSNTDALVQAGAEPFVASLHPPDKLDEAVAGVDVVIHSAGGGRADSVQSFYDNNTETTRNLFEACRNAPSVRRFILVSSIAAHGPSPTGEPRDAYEDCTPITHYGRSKAQAEAIVLDASAPFAVTILRPPSIYGPGDDRLLPMFRAANKGVVPLPGKGKATSLIYIDDCVEALCALASKEHPSPRIYFVEDGTPLPLETLAHTIGDACGRKVRCVRVPMPVLKGAAALTQILGKLRGKAVLLTSDKVRDLSQPYWICDASQLRDELGWQAKTTFEQGAHITARWYKDHAWI